MLYGLDDKPGLGPLLLYGLQRWVVLFPCVVVMGVVVARLHHTGIDAQTLGQEKMPTGMLFGCSHIYGVSLAP